MNENVNAELFTLVITKTLSFFHPNKGVSIMLILFCRQFNRMGIE